MQRRTIPEGTLLACPSSFHFPRVDYKQLRVFGVYRDHINAMKIVATLEWSEKTPDFHSALGLAASVPHPTKADCWANKALYLIYLSLKVPKKYLKHSPNSRAAFDDYICDKNVHGVAWLDTRELFEARKANVLKQVGTYWGIPWVGLV